jgi:hypothetical protein
VTRSNLCERFESDWELASLGALDDGQIREMTSHAEGGCELCQERLLQAQLALSAIGEALPEETLSAESEARLRKRIATAAVVPLSRKKTAIPAIVPWFATAASLALAAWLGFDRARLSSELQVARTPVPVVSIPAPAPVEIAVPPPPSVAVTQPEPKAKPLPDPALLAEVSSLRSKLEELTASQTESENQRNQMRQSLAAANARAQELERNLRETQVRLAAVPAQPSPPSSSEPAVNTQLAQDLARRTVELQNAGRQIAELRAALQIVKGASLRQVELRPSDPEAKRASARALVSSAGVLLIARDLPQLTGGKCYQLWLIRKGNPSIVSGGLVQTDASGGGILLAPPSPDLGLVTGFAITDEPAGGSSKAQGHKLLFGAL